MKLPSSAYSLVSVVLFVILFYQQGTGVNVTLFASLSLIFLLVSKVEFFNQSLSAVVASGLFVSALSFGFFGSPFALVIALVSFFMMFGLYTQKPLRNILFAVPSTLSNYFKAWTDFFDGLFQHKWFHAKSRLSKWLRIIVLPTLVIVVFAILYSLGSKSFGNWILDRIADITETIARFFEQLNIELILIGILGLIFSVIHSLKRRSNWISNQEKEYKDQLVRIRRKEKHYFKFLDLKYEYRSAVFLFAALNVLLAGLLSTEIRTEWIAYQWDGSFLKSSVHHGTYVLIFSIVLSIILSAYFFRKNLNFYNKNKNLKRLVYLWIVLNVVLVISVGIRNHHYIEYFALAYKRIGVYFFLLLCVIGLISLWYKIQNRKTSFFLIRVNALAAYIGLVLLCTVNWDVYIAKYNIAHANRSFIHLDFLMDLSDKALPYLQLSQEQITEIESKQLEAIPFAERGYFDSTNYAEFIAERIETFKVKQENKHWLSKNWAEYRAIQKIENQ